jgi:hypothetical protein
MVVSTIRGRIRRRSGRPGARLLVELLEERALLSYGYSAAASAGVVSMPSAPPTIDQAQYLGDLSATPWVAVNGTLGAGQTSTADVAWFSFSLARPAQVKLATLDRALPHGLVGVLSLYNCDPGDFGDYYDPYGCRLLEQAVGTAKNNAQLTQDLAAGIYYVAISGSGNRYFAPGIADSGYPGSTGNYRLDITADDLGLDPNGTPVLLGSDPAPGAVLPASPLILRLEFSAPLNTNAVMLGGNVQLTWNPTGSFGDGSDVSLGISSYNLSTSGTELQLIPAQTLSPGYYQITIGASLAQPATVTFQVAGVDGAATADDSTATAQELGNVTAASLVQVAGAIGDDSSAPLPFNQSDVDLYHFQITGAGRYAFSSEVFAGRIGSPLNPEITLYQLGSDGQLQQIAFNAQTLNPTTTNDNQFTPLYTDSAINAGLTAGEYYLAVSSNGTVFDPTQSHSGQGGWSTGDYVLNLIVQPAQAPAQVVATSPANGATLNAPPTQLVVQFSARVNVQQLAYQAYQQTGQGALSQVYIVRDDGTYYYPRLQSYDPTTNQATFLMLDALPTGHYELHLSGPQGLTDVAGNPLMGNTFGGDYVVHFAVKLAVPRGSNGDPRTWTYQPTNTGATNVQTLGTLFPLELQSGVTVVRPASAPGRAGGDYYWFQVLQNQQYLFAISGVNLPPGTQLQLLDANGNPVNAAVQADGISLLAGLTPGWYGLGVVGSIPSGVTYQIRMTLMGAADWQAPLTSGAAPALRIYLSGASTLPAGPLQVTVLSTAAVTVPTPSAAATALLAGLSSAPVGGVRGPTLTDGFAGPDRVLVQSTPVPPLASVISLTVLTQISGVETQAVSTTDAFAASATAVRALAGAELPALLFAPLTGDGASSVMRSCQQALDVFFSLEKWLETLPSSGPGARLVPDAPPAENTDIGTDGLEAMAPSAPLPVDPWAETRAQAIGEWTWAGSLAVLGIGTLAADARPRRGSTPFSDRP